MHRFAADICASAAALVLPAAAAAAGAGIVTADLGIGTLVGLAL